MQDLAFAVKWRPWQAAWSKTGTFSLVTAAGVATPASSYEDMFPVAIGHRTTSFFGRVVGLVQWKNGLFADLRGGYSVCTGEAPNVAVGSIRAGYAARRVFAAAWIAGQLAQGGTDIMEGSFRSNGVSYTRLGGQVYVPIVPSFGVYAGAATTLNGRNVGQSAQFSFGALFRSTL